MHPSQFSTIELLVIKLFKLKPDSENLKLGLELELKVKHIIECKASLLVL